MASTLSYLRPTDEALYDEGAMYYSWLVIVAVFCLYRTISDVAALDAYFFACRRRLPDGIALFLVYCSDPFYCIYGTRRTRPCKSFFISSFYRKHRRYSCCHYWPVVYESYNPGYNWQHFINENKAYTVV